MSKHPMSRSSPFPVEVRASTIHGNGLFLLAPVPAKRKVGEFVGEYISRREGRRRAKRRRTIAIVELNSFVAIDASVGGNDFRFVNHSCWPNSYMRRCYMRVEFYSLRDISSGEELTCDYVATHHEGTRRCRCKSVKCRGYI